eukprot:UN33364
MMKCALEDYKRHQSDGKENDKQYFVIDIPDNDRIRIASSTRNMELEDGKINTSAKASIKCKKSSDLKVGELIIVPDGASFPADLLLLSVAKKNDELQTFCHIETSNIDGQTNLKVKMIPEGLNRLDDELFNFGDTALSSKSQRKLSIISMMKDNKLATTKFENLWTGIPDLTISTSEPCGNLDKWTGATLNGNFNPDTKATEVELDLDNLLPRGAALQNSKHIIAMVVYTGDDCKVEKNGKQTASAGAKSSFVETSVNKIILFMASLLILLCITLSVCTYRWTATNSKDVWYLKEDVNVLLDTCMRFFTWMIIFYQLIPISLIVSIEMVRFFQAKMMESDPNMRKEYKVGNVTKVKMCNVQTSDLNEDLGLVEFVLSDKTGTLTENQLDFRQCI